MHTDLYLLYQDHATTDLLKIIMRPEAYAAEAIDTAKAILNTREVTQADIDAAQKQLEEDEHTSLPKPLLPNIFKPGINNYQLWITIILCIAVFDQLRITYKGIVIFDQVVHDPNYPDRWIFLLSYIDMLYMPFVLYLFYKRKAWGWITFFGARLFTLGPSILFYFKEYWPIAHGWGLVPYSMIGNLITILSLLFLWKKEVSDIFNVSEKAKWFTLMVVGTVLVILPYLNMNGKAVNVEANAYYQGPQTKAIVTPPDTSTGSRPKLLSQIRSRRNEPVDTTYMPTGFYFVAEDGDGILMRREGVGVIDTITRKPFASVKNIMKTSLEKIDGGQGEYTALCLTFDAKGTKDLAEGTGNPLHPRLAVVIANRLLFVAANRYSIKTGKMCMPLIGFTGKEVEEMRQAVDNKK